MIAFTFAFRIFIIHVHNICIFLQLKSKFTVDDFPHYVFTPRDLTNWVLGIIRYDIPHTGNSAEQLLQVVMYQSKRLFKDRLVGKESCDRFDGIVTSTLRNDWNLNIDTQNLMYFVTWGSTIVPSDQTELMRSFGRPLGPIAVDDFREIVKKGLISFGKACLYKILSNCSLQSNVGYLTINV